MAPSVKHARTLVNLKRNSSSRQGASRRRAVEEADEEEEQGHGRERRRETAATPHHPLATLNSGGLLRCRKARGEAVLVVLLE